jgi:tetraacyldisaccharide 4'-kinase
VGGTGKTPFLLELIAALQARGWHPGVVSRGYGVRVGPVPRVGQGLLDAREFGDEPALIARTSGAPIAVHPRRALAALALRRAHPEVDVVLSDDGLQHLALARDVEIVVQDGRGVGNGRLLPAGPLREPASRLATVDAVVTNLTGQVLPPLSPVAVAGTRQLAMQLVARDLRRATDGAVMPLHAIPAEARIAAAAGIGHPERFFATLRQAGIEPILTLALPDHHDYAVSPFNDVDAQYILVTDKDAVKCGHLNDPRIWAVTVSAHLSDPTFIDWLETRLHGLASA